METLDRIERKIRKLWHWCEILCRETEENHEQFVFTEAYSLIEDQMVFNLNDIEEMRVDYAHGVDISQGIRKLKWEFNFTTNLYRHLCHDFEAPYRPRRVRRRRPLRPLQWTFFILNFSFFHFSSMDNQCQVCGQTRPCCRQSLFELADNRHPKLVIPVLGEIREAWGLGSVWKTCCGTIYACITTKGPTNTLPCF